MFDMSWGEIMLIGGVALVVIGPKDLPRALRTVGQVTGKLKRMAGEFQVQFNEAMREAELDEARREVEGLNRSVANFNPVQTLRNEIGSIKDAVESAGRPSPGALAAATAQLQAEQAQAETAPAEAGAATADAPAAEAPTVPPPPQPSIDGAPLVAPEAAAGIEVGAPPVPPETVPPAAVPAATMPTPAETKP